MMEFIEYMPEYFKGEKGFALYAIPLGVLFLIIATSIWKFHWLNDVAKGLLCSDQNFPANE